MRGPLSIVTVVLLCLGLGLHWVAIQTLAWGVMLVERVQVVPLSEAVETTFDGEHPCRICLLVREGRAAEKTADGVPVSQVSKLDWVLRWETSTALLPVHGSKTDGFAPVLGARSRSYPPPLPPPRSV
jgi:hypothetical protein